MTIKNMCVNIDKLPKLYLTKRYSYTELLYKFTELFDKMFLYDDNNYLLDAIILYDYVDKKYPNKNKHKLIMKTIENNITRFNSNEIKRVFT